MLLSRELLRYSALAAGALALAACSDDDPPTQPPGDRAAVISQNITADRTLYSDTVYTLSGFIRVANGATLTIQPGTRIEGDFDIPGSSLFILRGSRIIAEGTASAPIVFTSGRAEGSREPGDWGGLIIVGNARINRAAPPDVIIEGTGTGADNPALPYSGGTDDDDDSGSLRYVRVEFAGYATAPDAELNSFTFAAVGRGTNLEYLQAVSGLDDHYEWFGGSVDARNLVSYESGDDHYDMSEGFSGRLQNLIAYQARRVVPRSVAGSPSSDPQGIENDGCHGSGCTDGQNSTPYTMPLVSNFTLVGTGPGVVDQTSGGIGMMLRRGTGGYYVNGVVARFPRAAISLRDQSTLDRVAAGDLQLKNLYLTENGETFQPASGSTVQGTVDLAANDIRVGSDVSTASLFTSFPAGLPANGATFDWTPAAGSPIASGGLATFTGAMATKAAGLVTGTEHVGAAAPAGPKWWQGWTIYAWN